MSFSPSQIISVMSGLPQREREREGERGGRGREGCSCEYDFFRPESSSTS